MGDVTVRVEGVKELLAKLSPAMIERPARNFLNRGTIIIQGNARRRAWVDRGSWRNSIVTEVDGTSPPAYGRVGSNLGEGGIVAMSIEMGSRPHWAPLAPLEAWAARHGMPGAGGAIQRKIAAVGTKPNHALAGGIDDSRSALDALVPVMAAEITSGAGK